MPVDQVKVVHHPGGDAGAFAAALFAMYELD